MRVDLSEVRLLGANPRDTELSRRVMTVKSSAQVEEKPSLGGVSPAVLRPAGEAEELLGRGVGGAGPR
jgi:hypothetical protein